MNDAFDLRLPLGVLFVICGGILLGHGIFVGIRVVGVNINLWWGVVMLVFGGLFLGLSARARRL
jgi:uncharacterized transporter YbjL